MEKNMNSWECDKLFASEASGPQKNLKMGLGGNLKFCGYGSGKECPDDHPKRCFRFCDFGSKNRKGCNKGKKCQYWHPKLCKYSVKGIHCRSEECTFQHLSLHRKPPKKSSEPPKDTYRRRSESEPERGRLDRRKTSLAPSQEMTDQKQMLLPKVSISSSLGPYQPTVTKPPIPKQERQDAEESFLFKLIQNLRAGLQEQIDGLRKEIVKERESRPPMQMAAPAYQQGMLAAEQVHPTYSVFPGMTHHSHLQALMAQQKQWMDQTQNCRPLSS